ncbi:MAG: DUF6491 family protein [Woeseiaceae bacterium]
MIGNIKLYIKQFVIVVISCNLLIACAVTEEDSDLGSDMNYQGSDCISIRTIRDYEPLDRQSLLMKAGGNRTYFVTLAGSSMELRSAFRLGFSSRDSWLCPYGGDRIVFEGISSVGMPIRSISRVNDEQVEELLIRYGKKRPPELQDPAPADLEGAEVEELG